MTVKRNEDHLDCPCCSSDSESPIPRELPRVESVVDRRAFLRTAGAAGAALVALPELARAEEKAKPKAAEDFVKHLFETLKPEQRSKICFPFDHPLRKEVRNNWHIVPQKIGEFLNADQQELCRQILKGITSEDGYARFQKSMKDDAGGLSDYSCALFGDPSKGEKDNQYQWVLTGRHITLRADGNTTASTAFGGPIFYGHAVTFNEEPGHPGNVWWHQGQVANQLFKGLDGKQRQKALLDGSPEDSASTVRLRGSGKTIPGLAGAELSKDQKKLLSDTLKTMLDMFRPSDVKEIMTCLDTNGGINQARVSFYKGGDLGEDQVWDRWKIEGPTFVWYFRGSPHVHTWVNIAHKAPKWV